MSPKRIKEEPAEEDGEKAAEKPKRKKKKKAVRREGLAEWDFQHRKECQFYPVRWHLLLTRAIGLEGISSGEM